MPEGQSSLGVLFVHGIGNQRKGDTLASFGAALYEWLELAGGRSEPGGIGRITLDDARLVVPEDPSAPAHARLTLRSGDSRADPVEWLLAESWWAESFGAPTFVDLATWGLGIIPWTLGSHFGAHVQAVWSSRTSTMTSPGRLVWFMRLARAVAGLLASLFLSVGALVAFAVMLVLALVPSATLRQWLGGVQQTLAGSMGDSYTLVVRPFERAAIVGQVRRDLAWLSARCRTLVIVAHSQGAAVSYLAVRRDRPANLRLLFTLGSGLRKLEELETIVKSGNRFKRAAALTLLGLLLTPTAALVLFGSFSTPSLAMSDPSAFAMILGEGVVGAALLLAGLLDFVRGTGSDVARAAGNTLADSGMRWADCYSTSDPVPNGSTFDVVSEVPAAGAAGPVQFSIESCNERSISRDHTRYWSNLDEFVGIVASAFAWIGAEGASVTDADRAWLAAIRRRRRWRIGFLVAMRWAAAAGAIATLVHDRDEWWNIAAWSLTAAGDWAGAKAGLWAASAVPARPPIAHVITMAALVLIGYAASRFVWRRWESTEVRELVQHQKPRDIDFASILFLSLQIVVVIGIARDSGDYLPGIWIGLSVAMSVMLSGTKPMLPAAHVNPPSDEPKAPTFSEGVVTFGKRVSGPVIATLGLIGLLGSLIGPSLWALAEGLRGRRAIMIAVMIVALVGGCALWWTRRRKPPQRVR